MSYVIPALSAYQVYRNITNEVPIVKKDLFGKVEIYKEDEEYEDLLKVLPGNDIKIKIQPFLSQQKIREDLLIVESPNLGICSATGTNRFKQGDAAVMLAPGLDRQDTEACHFVLKHEISHIKNNDQFTIPLVKCISTATAAVFCKLTMSKLPTMLLTAAVSVSVFSLFSQWREGKADDFAIEHSSNDELLGGRRFLIALQQINLAEHQTLWNKIDLMHPSLLSRIKKIENVLLKNGVKFDEQTEAQKIDNLKVFLIEKRSEIEKATADAGGILGILKEMYTL